MVQVERLTVQFSPEWEEKSGRGGNSPLLAPLVGLIQQCAPSLLTLNLRGVPFDELFDARKSNTTQVDPEVFQPLLVRYALIPSVIIIMQLFRRYHVFEGVLDACCMHTACYLVVGMRIEMSLHGAGCTVRLHTAEGVVRQSERKPASQPSCAATDKVPPKFEDSAVALLEAEWG